MLSHAARFLIASAAVSLAAFAPSPARACADIADAALDIIASGTSVSSGAPFFTLAQKNAFGYLNADIVTLWGFTNPGSPVYYDYILSGHYFTQITNVADLAAGDALVIDSTSTYSGHTVVIMDVPTQIVPALNPILANTTQWAVPIADSTTSSHGCNPSYPDSRWSGSCASGTFTAGSGTGFMRVYSDLSGNLQGYSWSVTSGGAYYAPATRPYVVGRLTPCPPLGNSGGFDGPS
jgi:hypothetical protein